MKDPELGDIHLGSVQGDGEEGHWVTSQLSALSWSSEKGFQQKFNGAQGWSGRSHYPTPEANTGQRDAVLLYKNSKCIYTTFHF